MDPLALLRSYVALQNECVASGDFARLLALFHPDAELAFDGISFGPFRGWERIRQAYREGPPSDLVDLIDVAWGHARALATYAWRSKPGRVAGSISLEGSDGLITRLVVTLLE